MKLPTVRSILEQSLASHFEPREQRNLIAYYLDAKRGDLLEAALSEAQVRSDVADIVKGHPIQYVTQTSFFYGYKFHVDERVLIPRPETEELVDWIIKDHTAQPLLRILDLGTGSGCILLSIMAEFKEAVGYGADVSRAALEVFNINQEKLGRTAHTLEYDMNDQQPDKLPDQLDIIVSNPPYIKKNELAQMDKSVIEHEPEIALFVEGEDALHFYKQIMDLAPKLLKPEGELYLETSYQYHEELQAQVAHRGLKSEFRKDLSGQWRMLKLWGY